jgi:hypothetical protein
MTMPQLAAVQEEVVALGGGGGDAAAGAVGIGLGDVDIDDIDMPPPHALKVAINKHAAAADHRR